MDLRLGQDIAIEPALTTLQSTGVLLVSLSSVLWSLGLLCSRLGLWEDIFFLTSAAPSEFSKRDLWMVGLPAKSTLRCFSEVSKVCFQFVSSDDAGPLRRSRIAAHTLYF